MRWLAIAPALTLAVFGLPIVAGGIGTLLPAFGYLPTLGGDTFGWQAWRALASAPGFDTALWATLRSGWLATLLSLALALAIVAFVQQRAWARRLGEAMAPMLAMPHSALAIGFAFLIAPSGWIVRWLSPGLTGWDLPPDVATVGHPSGWPLVAALLLKEVPYLVLMTLAALNQVPARAQLAIAGSLGYGPVQAWFAVVLPQVYAQIRLPVYAVLAFSLSVVDVALILGPDNPPTLAVLAVRWFAEPDTRWVFPASAAAVLLVAVVAASIGLWWAGEQIVGRLARARLLRGVRSASAERVAGAASLFGALLLFAALVSMLGMALWSFAHRWRFPQALPSEWTLDNWQRQASSLWLPACTTLLIALASTLIACVLVVACLENESRLRSTRPSRSLWLLYLPLLVPQVAFLFGLQVLLVRMGADGRLSAVIWAHLVFVLPYLFLSLADPWRAFDDRYARAAASLGATPWRVLWAIKLPILLKPLLVSCAVAFAVSVGQYLPTRVRRRRARRHLDHRGGDLVCRRGPACHRHLGDAAGAVPVAGVPGRRVVAAARLPPSPGVGMTTAGPQALHLDGVLLRLKSKRLLGPLSATVEAGQCLTVMGPSGCGKSTLLAFIAGTLDPVFDADGQVHIGAVDLAPLPPQERRVGILFQDDLLFPHLSVGGNLAFALPAAVRPQAAPPRAHRARAGRGRAGRFRRARPRHAVGRPAGARGAAAHAARRAARAAARRALQQARCPAARRLSPLRLRACALAWAAHRAGDPRRGRCAGGSGPGDPAGRRLTEQRRWPLDR